MGLCRTDDPPCERVIGLFDGTKWQRSALLSFVPADRVDAIVTDAGAPPALVRAWRELGVEVVTVEPEHVVRSLERLPDIGPAGDSAMSAR